MLDINFWSQEDPSELRMFPEELRSLPHEYRVDGIFQGEYNSEVYLLKVKSISSTLTSETYFMKKKASQWTLPKTE